MLQSALLSDEHCLRLIKATLPILRDGVGSLRLFFLLQSYACMIYILHVCRVVVADKKGGRLFRSTLVWVCSQALVQAHHGQQAHGDNLNILSEAWTLVATIILTIWTYILCCWNIFHMLWHFLLVLQISARALAIATNASLTDDERLLAYACLAGYGHSYSQQHL